ncbi:hypothetical protein [Paenibacillus harenae]|uniref:hypothetical protein n=1 Tax=Paenibacillus harenae TaxID=306543 RepID=UPI00040741F2|nr:hypothetical protein [Paenibacillus harenae]
MAERVIVFFLALGGMLLYDGFQWRSKLSKRDKLIYTIMLLIALYMGADYVLHRNWPDFYVLIDPIFGGMAKAIDDYLNVRK